MQNDITIKQLRSFGLIVGGIFALIGFWPFFFAGLGPRTWAVVSGGLSSHASPCVSQDTILALQRVDEGRARARLDQHENYSGYRFLRYRHSYRCGQTVARKRSHGSTLKFQP